MKPWHVFPEQLLSKSGLVLRKGELLLVTKGPKQEVSCWRSSRRCGRWRRFHGDAALLLQTVLLRDLVISPSATPTSCEICTWSHQPVSLWPQAFVFRILASIWFYSIDKVNVVGDVTMTNYGKLRGLTNTIYYLTVLEVKVWHGFHQAKITVKSPGENPCLFQFLETAHTPWLMALSSILKASKVRLSPSHIDPLSSIFRRINVRPIQVIHVNLSSSNSVG